MAAAPDGGHRSVVIEADGGSRGNPGDAAYGAVLMDAVSGEVIAERAERIGVATNNVAEYRGLIAGLELYHEHTPGADLEVRMDSKLVVEQMSGRWKIKHPDMRPLAMAAGRLAPSGTTYTWIPRDRNTVRRPHPQRGARCRWTDGPGGRRRSGQGEAAEGDRLESRPRHADDADPGATRRDAAHQGEEVQRPRRRRPRA